MLASRWQALQISLGVGYEQDTATLTLEASSLIQLPRRSAELRFVADGSALGTFAAREISGSTRDGTILIECTALDPEASIRQPRDRSSVGGRVDEMARTIAANADLTPIVNAEIGSHVFAPRPQLAVSDLAFLQRLVESAGGRVLIQEGRLIVTAGDQALDPLPALRVDLLTDGAWVDWRRGWSDRQPRIQAAYLLDDRATVEVVEVGSGSPTRRLPTTYATRTEALAAASSHITYGETSQDYLEIHTALTPTAQVLQPLDLVGASERIPTGFPALVVHAVQHTLGRSAAETTLTARPAASTTSA